ncbi:FG-GAP-like repeat-containing protein [Fodinibius salsisoli]|uniref:VCBS repeat-containing protein n=1 Tax=Fodinibius salsisoli TaxID=2820877 RepID=A0ABT3PQ56_9BACT|nr:FG-GAP-like repeat-containing protein [Fodinibius salsisoli]MCW9707981.1 VCBS repeat-containing protein [Fodinibius salsisoli]
MDRTGLVALITYKRIFVRCLYLMICVVILSTCTPPSQPELQWQQEEGYRWAELQPEKDGTVGFEYISSATTNIEFANEVSTDSIRKNRHYLNGSGVAAGDIDGDGLVDLYFASLEGPNKLYKNIGGFEFKDITEQAGVAHEGYNSTGVVLTDVTGDGFPDLLVTSLTKTNELYINDGKGHFSLKKDSGLGKSKGSKTMTLADINSDGLLDLYITNYKLRTVRDLYSTEELDYDNTVTIKDGELIVNPPFDEYYTVIETEGGPYMNEVGTSDELYINQGEGSFKKTNSKDYFLNQDGGPTELPRDWGLTAKFQDVTGNGEPDLYVANDFWTPDRFWINQGDGTFQALNPEANPNISFASMGVDFSDINKDGHLDYITTEMLSQSHRMRMRQFAEHLEKRKGHILYNRNSLYLNRRDTTFAQIAHYSGLEASEWSWATYFMDVDLDGYEDVVIATGFAYDYQDMDTQIKHSGEGQSLGRGKGDVLDYPPLKLKNKAFRNNGDLMFSDVSTEWGFKTEDVSMGMALADLNNDGDLDLIMNRFNDTPAVYENQAGAPRIAVRLKGQSPNTAGIGAKVQLKGGPVPQKKEITAGGNYLSDSQKQVVFAAQEDDSTQILVVTWRDGEKSVIRNVKGNRIYEVYESGAVEPSGSSEIDTVTHAPIFADESDLISHTHHENEYDEFRFHPLLPKKLSRQGPGVAWVDVNEDGLDDLIIGSGKGSATDVFQNTGNGFKEIQVDQLTDEAPGDQTSIISWSTDKETNIVVGSANYEQGDPNVPSAYIYGFSSGGNVSSQAKIPGVLSTTGPIAAADYNGDDWIDLFIGGRFKPLQYPKNATSRLVINNGGEFQYDARNTQLFSDIGLVTGAVFTDFDSDGDPDLLLSMEWYPLKLFENDDGVFNEITKEVGLDQWSGWWNGIATGDFNNDGRPDIVATNLGLNSPYQIDEEHPPRMYYQDFNGDGKLDIVEAYYDRASNEYVPRNKLYDFDSMPSILRNVPSHRAYAKASVGEIFGRNFANIPYKEIKTLRQTVFLNTSDGFKAHPLPAEAQFTSASYVGVADFNNDGNEDLFLGQNNFSFRKSTPRLDAGRGLLLRGDGQGQFLPVLGTKSGIKIYGEQRGAGFSDFNEDRKVDLVISQNSGQTKVYVNQTKKPGISIRLVGPESNRDAIGSSIRIVYQDGSKGPRREIQAGSGYWSQNSKVQVMGTSREPDKIQITWFDGTTTLVNVSEDQENVIYYSK